MSTSSEYQFLQKFQDILPYGGPSALWTLMLSLCSIIIAVIFYRTNFKKKGFEQKIPGPKVNGIITNVVPILSIYRNKAASNNCLLFQVACAYSHVFRKEGMWLFFGGHKKILMLYKAETVEPVLSSNSILSKGFEYEFISPLLKEGLLASKRDKWRSRRKLLTPSFHFRILDEFIPVFNDHARVFAGKIEELRTGQDWIDIQPLCSLCTLDIICETAMGIQINALNDSNNPYVHALHEFSRLTVNRLLSPWLWPDIIYFRTKSGKDYKRSLETMDNFTRKVVADRKEEKLSEMRDSPDDDDSPEAEEDAIGRRVRGRRRLALLDLLLDAHLKDPSFTVDDISEEVDNFMFAGHDTTSSGLAWALYMIGTYPDVQEKVHQEIDEVLGDDEGQPITLDHIKDLKYLDCVLKETRRLWPPTPFIARDLEEDAVIDGYTIPKGTSCGILIYMLHRDPEVFPNPEKFDPDRFLLSNSSGRHPFAYVPFSAGPRNCIGQRFAIFEAITVMATIMRKYKVAAVEPVDTIHVIAQLILRSEHGLKLRFEPRKVLQA